MSRREENDKTTHFRKPSDKLFGKSLLAYLRNQLLLLRFGCILPFSTYQPILYIPSYFIIKKKRILVNESDLRSP